MADAFYLFDLWTPDRIKDYKVHFARWNGDEQPLHAFVRDFNEWKGWQETYPGRNEFNRPFVLSLMQFPDVPNRWLFGGIWRVRDIKQRPTGEEFYDVDLTKKLKPLIGRLILDREHRKRATRVNLEGHFEHFRVSEILASVYAGRAFPGYDRIDVGFRELETLMANGRQDWSTALSHVKGIYLITDTKTKRRYVGSAYGGTGIWSRWQVYVALGHGGNAGMRELLRNHDLNYCRDHFRFALLECHHSRVDDQTIISRENFWKDVLDTRDALSGLNRN